MFFGYSGVNVRVLRSLVRYLGDTLVGVLSYFECDQGVLVGVSQSHFEGTKRLL